MNTRDSYVQTLQNFQHVADIRASTWTFRTIGDMCSVSAPSEVITAGDRAAILGRGLLAIGAWLPVNLVAIPHVFILGAVHRKTGKCRPIPQLHEIIDGLYLGTQQAATNAATLKDLNITAVLSLLQQPLRVPPDIVEHQRLELEDHPHVDLRPTIAQACEFVERQRRLGRRVLVHCEMGKSRSASIMVALVQHLNNLSAAEALALVEERRPVIGINYGFRKQLLRETGLVDL